MQCKIRIRYYYYYKPKVGSADPLQPTHAAITLNRSLSTQDVR